MPKHVLFLLLTCTFQPWVKGIDKKLKLKKIVKIVKLTPFHYHSYDSSEHELIIHIFGTISCQMLPQFIYVK